MKYRGIYTLLIMMAVGLSTPGSATAAGEGGRVRVKAIKAASANNNMVVSMTFNLDSLTLKSDHLMAYTPYVEDARATRHCSSRSS